jgi:primosomal replication protein N''
MRVVSALPALFRAKRCVVSGDEKQLPPTSFFGSRADVAADDGGSESTDAGIDNEIETVEDDAEAAPRLDPRALQVAERHIKDCEDLLALSRGHLPETSLDIHYRSQYRELIAFSNAAYYGGRLNVPVSRSPADVITAKPIEVRRVDGLYKNQSNPDEADAIVEFLAELWAREANPPTIGVVTFNMKQAEMILGRLDARADQDRAFGRALIRERTRKAQGEDVGFFVKNLENVQGDERDWIVFSTTFGHDEDGVFRRSFGALNQQGGERRLNVAVTRAKQKVVIVTSMPTAEISDALGSGRAPVRARDYLQIYMQYAELVSSGDLDEAMKLLQLFGLPDPRAAPPQQDEPDELIQQALAALRAEGFDAAVLPREDAFSVDIAVSDPGEARYVLGVEFDSPRHKLLARARAREIWRPKLMTRSGLRLHRISSAEWVRNPDAERDRLLEAARQVLGDKARRSEAPADGVMEETGA